MWRCWLQFITQLAVKAIYEWRCVHMGFQDTKHQQSYKLHIHFRPLDTRQGLYLPAERTECLRSGLNAECKARALIPGAHCDRLLEKIWICWSTRDNKINNVPSLCRRLFHMFVFIIKAFDGARSSEENDLSHPSIKRDFVIIATWIFIPIISLVVLTVSEEEKKCKAVVGIIIKINL